MHGCGGLVALDADDFPRWQELGLDKIFEATFTVQTGRVDELGNHTGRHFYIICPDSTDEIIKEFKLQTYYNLIDSTTGKIGELRLHHCQTVGPGSGHPNGNTYEIINDADLKVISVWKILNIFENFIDAKDRTWKIPDNHIANAKDANYSSISINVRDLVKLGECVDWGDEIQGPHPVHGSETGHNFSMNTSKNVWHCFRCGSGGGPLELLAVLEGIISCREAGSGSLRGEKFKRVLEAAGKRGYSVPTVPQNRGSFALTDLGNAKRLAYYFGDELRYCGQQKSWMVWDGSSWRLDITGEAVRLAKEVARKIYAEASATDDGDKRKKVVSWGARSESVKNIRDMLHLAETERTFAVSLEDFDSEVRYFNLENGVFDVETLEFLPHDRNRLITKVAGTRYSAQEECPLWEKFLDEIFGGNKELIKYVQRVIGYAFTGRLIEQVFFFLYGYGSNGKSTFLNVILALFGDYGKTADINTFMVKRNEGIRNDLADLAGVRYIMATEPEQGAEFSIKVLKRWTGNEKIKCRFLHKEYFEYLPQGQIFIAANLKPEIKEKTDAPWRRLHLWPFTVKIENIDTKLEDKLKGELPGILNWAIEGLRKYKRISLSPPQEVLAAVKEYRQEMNTEALFVDRCCVIEVHNTEKIANKTLYESYCEFCVGHGLSPDGIRDFTKEIRKLKGVGEHSLSRAIHWSGIRLNDENQIVITEPDGSQYQKVWLFFHLIISHFYSIYEGHEVDG